MMAVEAHGVLLVAGKSMISARYMLANYSVAM